MIAVAGAAVKCWANRQASVALSSAEVEFYAAVRTTMEVLGMKSMMMELGWCPTSVAVLVDADAAKAIMSRRGLGRTKHVDVRFLWVQERIARKEVVLGRVAGTWNPADALTKLETSSVSMPLLHGVSAF